jgi:hypothetical protein
MTLWAAVDDLIDRAPRLSDHERTLDRLGIAGHDYPVG